MVRIWQIIYRLTLVSTVAILLLSIISLFGNHVFLELSTHFRLQYILIGVLNIIVLAGFRSWKLALVAVLVIAFNALYLRPYYLTSPLVAVAEQGSSLRLVQINVLYTNRNSAQVLAAIKSASADVVVLQELTDEWRELLQSLEQEYPHYEWQPRPRGSGMAILSRLPLQGTRVIELDSGTSRPAILTRVSIGSTSVTLFSLHPPTPVTPKKFTHRNRQFREAAAILSSVTGPKVLIGDLNTTMWSPYFAELLRDGGLRDARVGFGLQTTWPRPLPALLRIPIDHCLVSEQISVESVRLGLPTGSDHCPLIIDLKI